MTQKVFIGLRTRKGLAVHVTNGPDCLVWNERGEALAALVDERQAPTLPLYLELANHSPTGFECGYLGSGPAQLALAIAVTLWGREVGAQPAFYQDLKTRVVAVLPQKGNWLLTEGKILSVMATGGRL